MTWALLLSVFFSFGRHFMHWLLLFAQFIICNSFGSPNWNDHNSQTSKMKKFSSIEWHSCVRVRQKLFKYKYYVRFNKMKPECCVCHTRLIFNFFLPKLGSNSSFWCCTTFKVVLKWIRNEFSKICWAALFLSFSQETTLNIKFN